jgi:hypothetical protein
MMHIYSRVFLFQLSCIIADSALVAAYMPSQNVSPRFQQLRHEVVQNFEATGRYRFIGNYETVGGQIESDILRFQRVKK